MRVDWLGKLCLLVAGLAAAGCGATSSQAPPPAEPTVSTVAAASEIAASTSGVRLKCETYCNEERRGVVNARITWSGPAAAADAEAVPQAPLQERLETTVFNGGFEKGLFAAFPLLGPGERMETAPAVKQAMPDLPAYNLRIQSVERGRQQVAPRTPGQEATVEPASSVVIEGLEPGLSYTWRLLVQTGAGKSVSETVTCMAPVCPADQAEED